MGQPTRRGQSLKCKEVSVLVLLEGWEMSRGQGQVLWCPWWGQRGVAGHPHGVGLHDAELAETGCQAQLSHQSAALHKVNENEPKIKTAAFSPCRP